jgi:hypothetical protein
MAMGFITVLVSPSLSHAGYNFKVPFSYYLHTNDDVPLANVKIVTEVRIAEYRLCKLTDNTPWWCPTIIDTVELRTNREGRASAPDRKYTSDSPNKTEDNEGRPEQYDFSYEVRFDGEDGKQRSCTVFTKRILAGRGILYNGELINISQDQLSLLTRHRVNICKEWAKQKGSFSENPPDDAISLVYDKIPEYINPWSSWERMEKDPSKRALLKKVKCWFGYPEEPGCCYSNCLKSKL